MDVQFRVLFSKEMETPFPCVLTPYFFPFPPGAASFPAAAASVLVHIDPMVIEEALALGLTRSDGK